MCELRLLKSTVSMPFQDCPDAALDAVIKICEGLSAAHRNVVVRKLAELELVQDGA